jgi:hypothetical protein
VYGYLYNKKHTVIVTSTTHKVVVMVTYRIHTHVSMVFHTTSRFCHGYLYNTNTDVVTVTSTTLLY